MGILGKLLKTAITIVEVPFEVTKDVLTLGGTINEKDKTYTEKKLSELGKNVEEIKEEINKL